MKTHCIISSPLGNLLAVANESGICELRFFDGDSNSGNIHYPVTNNNVYLNELKIQLSDYFARTRKSFDLPLCPEGTPFQKKVWDQLLNIPYGQTTSYMHLAVLVGDSKSVRAVAGANAKNPIMILIPCHRTVGIKGELTGYAGGLRAKRFLLELEGAIKPEAQLELIFPE